MRRVLTIREQAMLAGAAAALFGVGLWSLVWQPALHSKHDSLAQLAKLDTLQATLHALPPVTDASAPPTDGPLQQRVTQTASAARVEIRRLDPQGEALSVSLDAVRVATLIQWIDAMTQANGIRVLAAEIGRLPEPGQVTARLLLEDL